MRTLLGNAFSLGMLDQPEGSNIPLHIKVCELDEVREALKDGFESCIGHEDTALLVSSLLGMDRSQLKDMVSGFKSRLDRLSRVSGVLRDEQWD